VRISLDIQLILIKILCQRVGESMTITDILILLRQILYCTPKEGGGGVEEVEGLPGYYGHCGGCSIP
jgi:hypothetical protein